MGCTLATAYRLPCEQADPGKEPKTFKQDRTFRIEIKQQSLSRNCSRKQRASFFHKSQHRKGLWALTKGCSGQGGQREFSAWWPSHRLVVVPPPSLNPMPLGGVVATQDR